MTTHDQDPGPTNPIKKRNQGVALKNHGHHHVTAE